MVISFSFSVLKGRIDEGDTLSLNEVFSDDAVIVDTARQVVHIDRSCHDAAREIPSLIAGLMEALPEVTFDVPAARQFPSHGSPRG